MKNSNTSSVHTHERTGRERETLSDHHKLTMATHFGNQKQETEPVQALKKFKKIKLFEREKKH